MDIVCGEVTHLPEVKSLQDLQGLAQVGPLGPGPTLINIIPTVFHHDGLLDEGSVGGQIGSG